MNYFEFLNHIIHNGIKAAKNDYVKEYDKPKLEGSIAGFEACKGKTPDELRILFETSSKKASEEMYEYHRWRELLDESKKQELWDKYWYHRCFEAEVEWVCNCVRLL